MAVKVGIRDDGGEIGGVRQRRDFVAKVGPGNHGTGGGGQRDIQPGGHAHQCHADGTGCAPGGAGTNGDHAGNEKRGDQDILRADQF
ncbi:hypothetical protein D3C87_2044500 [compost metagenome]